MTESRSNPMHGAGHQNTRPKFRTLVIGELSQLASGPLPTGISKSNGECGLQQGEPNGRDKRPRQATLSEMNHKNQAIGNPFAHAWSTLTKGYRIATGQSYFIP